MSETENNNVDQTEVTGQNKQEQVTQPGGPVFHLDGILVKRLIANFIDSALIGVVVIILSLVGKFLPKIAFVNLSYAWSALVFAAGAAIFMAKDGPIVFAGLEGQTPGKKAMGIRVTDLNKKPISFEVSMKRNFILAIPYMLSSLTSLLEIVRIPLITGLILFFLGIASLVISMFVAVFEIYKIYSGERNRRWGDTYAGTIVSWE